MWQPLPSRMPQASSLECPEGRAVRSRPTVSVAVEHKSETSSACPADRLAEEGLPLSIPPPLPPGPLLVPSCSMLLLSQARQHLLLFEVYRSAAGRVSTPEGRTFSGVAPAVSPVGAKCLMSK